MGTVSSRFKKGRITIATVDGVYDKKPTRSYTIQKSIFNKEQNKWIKSDFFTITDIQDLQELVNRIVNEYVKYEKVEQYKPAQTTPQKEVFKGTFNETVPQEEPY